MNKVGSEAGVGETVLVVDDEPAVRELAGLIIGRLGYRIVMASSGKEALAVARELEGEISLLFTDVVMPCMDGVELAERLSAENPGLKVLFFSGYVTQELLQRIANWPGGGFLRKPCAIAEVQEALDSMLAPPPTPPCHLADSRSMPVVTAEVA